MTVAFQNIGFKKYLFNRDFRQSQHCGFFIGSHRQILLGCIVKSLYNLFSKKSRLHIDIILKL